MHVAAIIVLAFVGAGDAISNCSYNDTFAYGTDAYDPDLNDTYSGSGCTIPTTSDEPSYSNESSTAESTREDGSTTTSNQATGGMTTGPTPLLALEHYLIIAGGGGLLILILLFGCIFFFIYCCCFKSGDKSKKSKSKKPGDDSIAQWTEEGRVQLLNIAEKAGIDDTNKSKPEAEVSGQPDGSTAAPVPPTAPAAEDKSEPDTGDTKGDGKREVTVATFGFSEVSTQPPTKPDGEVEDTEMGPVTVPIQPPEPDCKKQPSTVLESNSDSGVLDPTVVSIGGIPLPPPPPPVPNTANATPAGPTAQVQTQAALPLHLQAPSLPVVTQGDEDDLNLTFDLGTSILSTEAIEKALGITST